MKKTKPIMELIIVIVACVIAILFADFILRGNKNDNVSSTQKDENSITTEIPSTSTPSIDNPVSDPNETTNESIQLNINSNEKQFLQEMQIIPSTDDASVIFEDDMVKYFNNINFNENFNNLNVEKDGYKFNLSCISYDSEETSSNKCKAFKVLVNGKDYNIIWDRGYGYTIKKLTNNYIILYENGFESSIKVINKDGEEVFNDNAVFVFGLIQGDNDTLKNKNFYPIIKNNKLYYIRCVEYNKNAYASVTYLDLTSLEIVDKDYYKIGIGLFE